MNLDESDDDESNEYNESDEEQDCTLNGSLIFMDLIVYY